MATTKGECRQSANELACPLGEAICAPPLLHVVQAKTGERGATLVMVAFISAFLLIPIIGVCIDGAMVYWVKARLSAAIDAATLTTARALNVGQTTAQQEANAIAMGQEYFTANFPLGMLQTSHGSGVTIVGGENIGSSIQINETQIHQRTVTLTVSATVPMFFMGMMGFKTSTVTATGQATRRDANVVMVLDRSGSMNSNGSCSALMASAQNFANQFVNGRDQLGLVTFSTSAYIDYAPTLNFKSANPSLNNTLAKLMCDGDTGTPQGLTLGFQQITNVINQPGSLNVILLFTDGEPNSIVAPFVIKASPDSRYDSQNTATMVNTPKSTCTVSSPLYGIFGDLSKPTATSVTGLSATGYTGAVLNPLGVPLSSNANPTTISAAGCSFNTTTHNWNYAIYGRKDIAALPEADYYGNSLADRGMVPPLDRFAAGPYIGQIRPDMPRTARWAAFNATDSRAQTIRNNTTYGTVIYAIGLQGNEPMAMDQDFMERLANDSRASNFDATKPSGQFILATNAAELSQAFQQVASQILRLSR